MLPTTRIYKPRSDGYVRCKLNDGRVGYLHRLIMEQLLSRKLKPKEIVHHRNTLPTDNRTENLEFHVSQKSHLARHKVPRIKVRCQQCGKKFPLKRSEIRNRKSKGCSKFFCSRPCFVVNLKDKPFSGKSHRWPKGYDPPSFRVERERRNQGG